MTVSLLAAANVWRMSLPRNSSGEVLLVRYDPTWRFAKMVGRIVQSRLPTYVSFVEFPPCFSQRLSNAAWLIEPSGFASNVSVVIPWLGTPLG
jgi:hypothetical protein